METLQTIREDLREIRYYYAKKKQLDTALEKIAPSCALDKVLRYNEAIKQAPIRLYDLYISLYVENNTQVALAYDWGYSNDYIKQLNKQLCEFFLNSFKTKL